MSTSTLPLTAELRSYLLDVTLRETEVQRDLREVTADHPEATMQIAPEQGQFMAFLVKLMGAMKTLEVGVFTGYSALSVALALPPNGQIVACDIDEDYTRIARRFWEKAGIAHKIDLRIGPAADTLARLNELGHAGTFDFAFIDADKANYDTYYEQALKLLRTGGLLMLDNMLRSGRVIDDDAQDDGTRAIRALNEKLHADDRIDLTLLPLADGVTLARKR